MKCQLGPGLQFCVANQVQRAFTLVFESFNCRRNAISCGGISNPDESIGPDPDRIRVGAGGCNKQSINRASFDCSRGL